MNFDLLEKTDIWLVMRILLLSVWILSKVLGQSKEFLGLDATKKKLIPKSWRGKKTPGFFLGHGATFQKHMKQQSSKIEKGKRECF